MASSGRLKGSFSPADLPLLNEAAAKIQRFWCSYRDKQLYRMLKSSLCSAEESLSGAILKRICPPEIEIFKDPTMRFKIRFRFGGTEFPPIILFKIFLSGKGVKYMTGKQFIEPGSDAAEDARQRMGNRKFFDQMLVETIQQQTHDVREREDVATLQDYMQLISHVDESPASFGGKANYWRKLSLDALPRHHIMYDIVEYLNRGIPSAKLRKHLPYATSRPQSQKEFVQQIRAISAASVPRSMSGRRSQQSKVRVAQMKRHYGKKETESPTKSEENELEDEALQLYEWTQELNLEHV
ncbi:uncharacterized protein CXorf58 homolog [Oscarella lobularis]|uniref:uncharacterized protein CXorf58 homolog n=1 Tax=Oscarella lobularis TaxID=121494 RepID=UPI003313C0F6